MSNKKHTNAFHFDAPDLSGIENSQTYRQKTSHPFWRYVLMTLSLLIASGLLISSISILGYYQWVLKPKVPATDSLKDIQFQVPVSIYTRDGLLISEIGEKKRDPIAYQDTPKELIHAIISAEDDRFFEHQGVDLMGLLRAAVVLATTGEKAQGGSTITMQMARNFFLSQEKSYERKMIEILLARKIEENFSKEDILELYMNKIFLGHRSYGFQAASKTYYGKDLKSLNLAQIAMIAGLPKAPSSYNPVTNPQRALQRRNYVLKRMLDLGHISNAAYQNAVAFQDDAKVHGAQLDMDAGYVAEYARAQAMALTGDPELFTKGYKIYTTVDSALQKSANESLAHGLMEYVRRQGEFKPLLQLNGPIIQSNLPLAKLNSIDEIGTLKVAVVHRTSAQSADLYLKNGTAISIRAQDLVWVKRWINDQWRASDSPQSALKVGEVVYVEPRQREGRTHWLLAGEPTAQGALVSINAQTGAIQAMNGGFEFAHYKFNRAEQALRQPGSCFKPFIYSASLEKGYTAASIVNDAPVVFKDNLLEDFWKPTNFSGKFYGPTRLRFALAQSRNLVSIRLLQDIGLSSAIDHASVFGFDKARLNQTRNLSLSLGASAVTPLELTRGYAVFANGGRLVDPYIIDRIESMDGEVIYQAQPAIACDTCEAPMKAPRVISPQNAYLMTDMMQDVIRYGTARQAQSLGRKDLAGKTGTTNDQKDAWFAGYNHQIVTSVWVGFDTPQVLGARETGGSTALPIWIEYMQKALENQPEAPLPRPDGLVNVRIDRKTGLATSSSNPDSMFEIFRLGNEPKLEPLNQQTPENKVVEDIF
jgi:penicillin-binding protein 1A